MRGKDKIACNVGGELAAREPARRSTISDMYQTLRSDALEEINA
jgi:hypothetical protein